MVSLGFGIFPANGVAAVDAVVAAPGVVAAVPAICAWQNPSPRSDNAAESSSTEPPLPGGGAFDAWTCCQCCLKTLLTFSPAHRIEKMWLAKHGSDRRKDFLVFTLLYFCFYFYFTFA